MDFLTLSEANKDTPIGWYKIAWAFLRLVSKDGSLNTGKRVRLQLYKPGNYSKQNIQECNVFYWWRQQKWVKYPASLHVTIKSVSMPDSVEKTTRSKTPLTAEIGSNVIVDSQCKMDAKTQEYEVNKIKWKNTEHQAYKMPNKCVTELETCNEGAFVVKFSNKGDFLAVAVVLNNVYTLKIFEVSRVNFFF